MLRTGTGVGAKRDLYLTHVWNVSAIESGRQKTIGAVVCQQATDQSSDRCLRRGRVRRHGGHSGCAIP